MEKVTLEELGEESYSDEFNSFWKSAKLIYKKLGNRGTRIHGPKNPVWGYYQRLGITKDHIPLLIDELNKMVDFYLKEKQDTGYSNNLPYLRTWLSESRFKEEVPDYVAPVEVKKKLATDRPPPEEIKTVKHKEYTKEEREKMQVDFNKIKKGVRKHGR